MDITAEQVDRVRSCTGASYEQARAALLQTSGNVLDAVILLEQQGAEKAGADYSTRRKARWADHSAAPPGREELKQALSGLLRHMLSVVLEIWKGEDVTCTLPLLILPLLLLVSPLAVGLVVLGGLCAGYKVHITGPGTESWRGWVNQRLDQLADTLNDAVLQTLREGRRHRSKGGKQDKK